ncbi:MAG TPA: hypothetical protein DHW45_11625 [Candidatus Latescibacteria bacterium]|nr:hypothetical protein [Candidatus Latescibacterota bacterium]
MSAYEPIDTDAPDFPSERHLALMMCRHIPYIEQYWVDDDEAHGHFGSLDADEFQPPGGPINEMIVRSMAQELQGYAALYRSEHFDRAVAGVNRDVLADRLNRCTRWLCAHHLTGDRRTEPLEWDGQWGDDWESSPWTADLMMAAHHVWDALDDDVQTAMLRVLAFEADRFLDVDPPDGRWVDTKAEENAWDSYLLAWAHCMMPDHSHAEQWLDRGKAFAINTFTTDLDRVDTRPIEGKALKDWICTQTAHPDMTVENHGSFHPGYLGCGGLLLTGCLAFTLTGRTPPPHYLHHVMDAWRLLRRFVLLNGFTAYPSGQDWSYHEPEIDYQQAVMFREFGDPIAGHLLWEAIRYLDESMRYPADGRFNGRMPAAAGGRYFQFETGVMAQLGVLTISGIPSVKRLAPEAFRQEQVGTECYPYVWLQVRRSRQGLLSFAWRSLAQGVMGMVVPAGGENIFGSEQDAFTGRFEMAGERLKPRPLCHTDHTTERGFTTTGVVEYGDGLIRQSLAVVALEDGETSIVIDWTVAEPGIDLTCNEAFGLYVMNDFMNENRVAVSFEGGRRSVRGVGGKARVIETGSSWIKVAGCLGLETSGDEILYEDASERNTPSRWKSLLQDRIYLSPGGDGSAVRDFACVVRQGRAGTRRVGGGVERLDVSGAKVRAFRFGARKGVVTVAANFGQEAVSLDVVGRTVVLPAMDTLVLD